MPESIMTPEEAQRKIMIFDGQPPPPPPPPFMLSVKAATLGWASGGLLVALNTNILMRSPFILSDAAASNFLWWAVVGFLDGAIFGAVVSLVYNAVVKWSRDTIVFRNKYPAAKDLPHDHLFTYWIQQLAAHFYDHVHATFERKK